MPERYVNAEVPVHTLPDGRDFIAVKDVEEQPWLQDFVKRFDKHWRFSCFLQGWVGPAPDEQRAEPN